MTLLLANKQMREYLLTLEPDERIESLLHLCEAGVVQDLRDLRDEEAVYGNYAHHFRQLGLEPPARDLRHLVAVGKITLARGQESVWEATSAIGREHDPDAHLARRIRDVKSWRRDAAFNLGVDGLDGVFGGVLPGEITAITGAQGSMKTSLALCAVEQGLDEGKRISFFSLDMSPQEVAERRLQLRLELNQHDLHELIREGGETVKQTAREMAERDLDRFLLAGNERSKRWMVDDVIESAIIHRSDVLVIDYLTLLKPIGKSDLECAEKVMPKLKNFAQRNSVAVVLLNQMSRASKREQAAGMVGGHGKGGGIIEEMVHSEIELLKDYPEHEGGCDRIIATVTKTRRGATRQSFDLDYKPWCLKFTGYFSKVGRDAQKNKPVFSRIDAGFR